MNQLVIGWGNPIAGDDGIGPRAAKLVSQRVPSSIQVTATSHSGLRLVEGMCGYDRVIVADVRLEDGNTGIRMDVIHPRALDALDHSVRHDSTLIEAVHAFANLSHSDLPKEIILLSVPIPAPTDWRGDLSLAGERAAHCLADAVIHELEVTAVV